MLSNRFKNNGIPHLDLNDAQLLAKAKVESKIESLLYLFENVSCPICGEGNTDCEMISEKDRYGLDYKTVICKSCGLLYANPRMTQDAYNEFYNEEYRLLYTAEEVSSSKFFEDQVFHGNQIHSFIKENTDCKDIEGKSVLEIGCGAGGILKAFRDAGASITGLDLGEKYLSYGIDTWGLSLHSGTIHNLNFVRKPDIIIYSHVFEHILDLDKEILRIKELCNKDTLVYIEVPGVLNVHNTYNGDFLLYLQNAHTYHFTLKLLEILFSRYGFKLVAGNEFVKAIFILDENCERVEGNFHGSNMYYLRELEDRFKHPTFYRMKDSLRNSILGKMLRFFKSKNKNYE